MNQINQIGDTSTEKAKQYCTLGVNCLALAKKRGFKDKNLLKRATQLFFKSIRKNNRYPEPYIYIAFILIICQDVSKAKYFLNQAIELSPNKENALAHQLLKQVKGREGNSPQLRANRIKSKSTQNTKEFSINIINFDTPNPSKESVNNKFLELHKDIEKTKVKITMLKKKMQTTLSPANRQNLQQKLKELRILLKSQQESLQQLKVNKRCKSLDDFQKILNQYFKQPTSQQLLSSMNSTKKLVLNIYQESQFKASPLFLEELQPLLIWLEELELSKHKIRKVDSFKEIIMNIENMSINEKKCWIKLLSEYTNATIQQPIQKFSPVEIDFNFV